MPGLVIKASCQLACGILATDPKVSPLPKIKAWMDVSRKFLLALICLFSFYPLLLFKHTCIHFSDMLFSKRRPAAASFHRLSNQIKAYLFGFTGAICLTGLFTHQPLRL